jgi:molybdopterin converting factor small subunit
MIVVIDERIVTPDTVVNPGAELRLLPPISGG